MKFLIKIIAVFCVVLVLCLVAAWYYFGSVGKTDNVSVFIVPQKKDNFNLADSLFEQKLIKNKKGFQFIFDNFAKSKEIKPGGYKLNSNLNTLQVVKRLESKQDLIWVNIYYCPRKEQVGEKLAQALGWNEKQLNEWNNLFKNTEYYEGVFYPDTYLIPIDEPVEQVAQRFIKNFEEKMKPYSDEYLSKNIKWTTGLKIASLIAREAAGREDAKLISGIIWNRLNDAMRLQIDATMQYTLGKNENGSWWGNISLEEKRSDSPYNTYRHEGLPPTPICSPNIDFIEAALNPEQTDCVYYLHDSNSKIHCAKTYSEHLRNIDKYL